MNIKYNNCKYEILLFFLIILILVMLKKKKNKEYFGNEKNNNFYNNVYLGNRIYEQNPEDLKEYFKSWKFCSDLVNKNKFKLILDIGCGPGHLPIVLNKYNTNFEYIGFDFSKVAIQMAKRKNKQKNLKFYVKNALEIKYDKYIKNKKTENILITSFEFLEHIEKDIDIISEMPKNVYFCFSVPNYDSKGHVRKFNNENEIRNRYSEYLDIYEIKKTFIETEYGIKNNSIIFIFWGKIIQNSN